MKSEKGKEGIIEIKNRKITIKGEVPDIPTELPYRFDNSDKHNFVTAVKTVTINDSEYTDALIEHLRKRLHLSIEVKKDDN